MISIFKNIDLQNKFEQNGYITIPLIDDYEVENLKKIYAGIPDQKEIFSSTSFLQDLNLKRKINNDVNEILTKKIDDTFCNYKSLGSGFLCKKSGATSEMPIHQDWTVVDESKYYTVTIWIPLQDVTIKNGAIQVIPGSHKFSDVLRSPSLPISFQNLYNDLKPFLKTLHLKAGEAFIFNHALFHASHENISGEDRIAVTYGMTNKEAELKMFYSSEEIVEEWSMPDDMFLRYPEIRHQPSIGLKKREFIYTIPDFKKENLIDGVLNYRKHKKMKPLFLDEKNQLFFEQNGFVLLPALSKDEIDELISFYSNTGIKDEKGYGFHVGMDNENKEMVKNMVTTLTRIALPKVQPYLHDTQLFTASYVVKEPNKTGVVPPHQDWAFVEDETQHCSVTCWIPLQDVNIDNGCMGVIIGSNSFFDSVRPSPSPQVGTPLKNHMFTIFPYLKLIEMKAGEALIFDNRTIHASPPNITAEARLAIGLGFTQREAEIRHYFLKPGTKDTLLKYNIDADFFLKYDNTTLSKMYDKGQTIQGYGNPEEIPYSWEDLSEGEFVKRMKDSGNEYNQPLIERMMELFDIPNNVNIEKNESKVIQEKAPINSNAKPFWKVYTPLNIAREIKHRITRN